jgi:hypothetical protein
LQTLASHARRLRPNTTQRSSPGHQLLMTRFGPVDLLGTIGKGRSCQDLLPHAAETELGKGLRVRVLDLETLIAPHHVGSACTAIHHFTVRLTGLLVGC